MISLASTQEERAHIQTHGYKRQRIRKCIENVRKKKIVKMLESYVRNSNALKIIKIVNRPKLSKVDA